MNFQGYPIVGMSKSSSLLFRATELRKLGKSYSEINKELNIPKSTLSNWFSDKKWSQSISRQLAREWSKIHTNRLIKINKSRKLKTLDRYRKYRKEAEVSFNKLKKNPLFLIGLSLYWGEGEKIDNGRVGLINTDVALLKIILKFYRKILKVPEEKLRAAIFIYKDNNKEESLKFWSTNLQIARDQFIKTQVLPSRAKITKRKLRHGICNVYFSSTEMNIKIRHWVNLLAKMNV